MKMMWMLALLMLLPALSGAQEENKIREEIDSMVEDHPLRLGILRVRPALTVQSGYDSNAITSAVIVESDTYTMVTPNGDVAMRLGHRGYVAVREDLNFVYYNNQDALRDIYNTTAARLVTGSRKLLLELNGGYLSRLAPYNGEVDQPVQQTSTTAGAELEFAIRRTTDLTFRYQYGMLKFQSVKGLPEELPPPPDNRTYEYGAGISQEVGRKVNADIRASTGKVKILPLSSPQTDSSFWRVLGGLSFTGRKLAGAAHAGLGETDSTTPGADPFRDLMVDANVTYTAGRRLDVTVFMNRRRVVSALLTDNFLLNTELGLRGSFPLAYRFFIDGGFKAGSNDYPQEPGQTPVTRDDYRQFEGAVNFELTEHVRIRANGTYQKRDSSDPLLSKDRFTMGIGLVMEP